MKKFLKTVAGLALAAALTVTPVFAAENDGAEEAQAPNLFTDSISSVLNTADRLGQNIYATGDTASARNTANQEKRNNFVDRINGDMFTLNNRVLTDGATAAASAIKLGNGLAKGAVDGAIYAHNQSKENRDALLGRTLSVAETASTNAYNTASTGLGVAAGTIDTAIDAGAYAVNGMLAN